MKFQNNKVLCPKCKHSYDDCLNECPKCHCSNYIRNSITKGNNIFWLDPLRQGLLFLIGFLGFNFLAMILSSVFVWIGKLTTTTDEALLAFINSSKVQMSLNLLCYIVVFIAILIIIWPFLNLLFKEFKKGKTWAYGLIGGIVLILVSFIYGFLINLVYPTEGNQNQESVVNLITIYPIASILLFGLAGPIVEEFTYRVGCFSFLRRWNKVAAYLLTVLIFALIHFNYNITNNEMLINELINIPTYFIAGAILCFIYEKTSWAGSVIAHIVNNLYACAFTLIMAAI